MIHNDNYTANCRDALLQLFLVTTLMSADMQRGLTERGLAAELKVTPRNVTTLIDALEGTGFVRRTAHPTDRRATVIVLTPKGRKAVTKLQSETTEFAKLLFGT